jgi:MoaA/NifB/PqqE/SkfB family radical SAM enzyme
LSTVRFLNSAAFKRRTPYWLQSFARRKVIPSPSFQVIYRGMVDREVAELERLEVPAPKVVYAESTNACNATCVMCPRDEMHRAIGIMTMDLFKKIADECADWGVEEMRLHNFGEPMIDVKLYDKIEYAKRKGIKTTTIYTNGALLSGDKARRLINAGLDKLYISFDGATKKTFETIRLPLSFDQVSENVRSFHALRSELKSSTPKVYLSFTHVGQNKEEREQFRRDWTPFSDKVFIIDAHDWAGQAEVELQEANNGPRWPCVYIWKSMTVLYSGEVTLCCMDIKGSESVGDANKQSLKEIWRGAAMKRIRAAHQRHAYQDVNLCKGCSLNRMWSLYD